MLRFHVRHRMTGALAAATLALLGACSTDVSTSPAVRSPGAANASRYNPPGWLVPGKVQQRLVAANCTPKDAAYGSASIGPSGGTLIIGAHRLIVPAGALTTTVEISGTVPNDRPFEINLQPHGLHFRKAAGLILDASDCTNVPNIVYLIDQYTTSDPIVAVYSNWWHLIACPIWHFSGYSIAFNEASPDGSSAQ